MAKQRGVGTKRAHAGDAGVDHGDIGCRRLPRGQHQMMREATFIVLYGLVWACVGFTAVTVFNLPSYAAIVLVPVGIALADRTGQGFGVEPFKRRSDDPAP